LKFIMCVLGLDCGLSFMENGLYQMETIKKYYRIDRTSIAYVRFTLEAYDGIANMTTLDPQKGIVRMAIAPGCIAEMDAIISDLKQHILIEPVDMEPCAT